jgi:SPW repeat
VLNWRRESILDVYTLILGTCLLAVPWLSMATGRVIGEEEWLSSALIVLLSIAALIAFAEWEEWGKLVLGAWLAVSPWGLGFGHTTAAHVSVGFGLSIAYLAAIELWLIRYSGSSGA